MKKVVIKESDLISIIEKVIFNSHILRESSDKELNTRYVIEATAGKKQFYWGFYRDGSTLFIPTKNFSDHNSKPKLFDSVGEAREELNTLKTYVPTYTYKIKPFNN